MARIKISEYRAKRLIAGDEYTGISIVPGARSYAFKKGRYVVKVDQGVKKRFKKGLVRVDVSPVVVKKSIREWQKKGYTRFLVEKYIEHPPASERYVSLERIREGVRVMYSPRGGVEIETEQDSVVSFEVREEGDVTKVSRETGIPEGFLRPLLVTFDQNYMAFLELNPLLVLGGKVIPLDAALLVDSAGEQLVGGVWSEADYADSKKKHPRELAVFELGKTTPASLTLNVINPNGSLFFLLSGGGGSITIGDHAVVLNAGSLIANYGEYSGGPTREETYLYAREIIGLTLKSRAHKKAIVIAGGIANFTDVQTTFAGLIDALEEHAPELIKAKIKVFVRRGGPREVEGLALMETFLKQKGIFGSIAGSDSPITDAVHKAVTYLKP